MLDKTNMVGFGSHTNKLHHFKDRGVMKASAETMEKDFLNFQRTFKKRTGTLTSVMAWPFGKYNADAIVAGQTAKFIYFLTSNRGVYTGDRTRIPRMAVRGSTDLKSLLSNL